MNNKDGTLLITFYLAHSLPITYLHFKKIHYTRINEIQSISILTRRQLLICFYIPNNGTAQRVWITIPLRTISIVL